MKVFLLEDEKVLAELYTVALQRDGFDAQYFVCSEDLLEALWEEVPDLVLLDYGLKGEEFNGLKVLNLLKKIWPRLPVAILSNFDHPALVERFFDNGVRQFLVKFYCSPRELAGYLVSGSSTLKMDPLGELSTT